MATQQYTAARAYQCPRCGGQVAFEHQALECNDCGYAPRHGAD